jgi:hypothetical protein
VIRAIATMSVGVGRGAALALERQRSVSFGVSRDSTVRRLGRRPPLRVRLSLAIRMSAADGRTILTAQAVVGLARGAVE